VKNYSGLQTPRREQFGPRAYQWLQATHACGGAEQLEAGSFVRFSRTMKQIHRPYLFPDARISQIFMVLSPLRL
jgi:hypothetical protein